VVAWAPRRGMSRSKRRLFKPAVYCTVVPSVPVMPLSPTGGDPGVREQDLLGVPSCRSSLVEHECPTGTHPRRGTGTAEPAMGQQTLPHRPHCRDRAIARGASPCRDRDGPRARSLVQSPRRLLMRGAGRPRAGSPPATRSRTVPPAGPGAIGCPPVCPSPSLRARLWTRRERGRHPATATTAVRRATQPPVGSSQLFSCMMTCAVQPSHRPSPAAGAS
jgi:hypothetical protein